MHDRFHLAAGAVLGAAVLLALPAGAQISIGGRPTSFDTRLRAELATEVMPWVDVQTHLLEDELNTEPGPWRFGATLEVDIDAQREGTWTVLPGGDLLWRLRISSPGALSISLIFDRYWVPPGATLHLYDDDRGQILGAYTDANLAGHGMFGIQPMAGDAVILEYREPAGAHQSADLHIQQVIHAYRDILGAKGGSDSGSGSCNVNVICPAGDPYRDEIRSSARLVMGGGLCSGALINNTADDGRQLFLTANHCYSGSPSTWVFQFNYEGDDCSDVNAPHGPSWNSVSGSVLRAKSSASDFCLVEISNQIPANFNVFYSGWDRSGSSFPKSAGIHHPSGDIKKICIDNHSASKTSWGGAATWHINKWDLAVTEGGSSGSPLHDDDGRIVGQLYGGQASCSYLYHDYYGRMDTSWNSGIKAWLDPLNTGVQFHDGYDPAVTSNNPEIYCTAKVNSLGGTPAIGWLGEPSYAAANFQIDCLSGLAGKVGILFYGADRNAQPLFNGFLCATTPLTRGKPFQFDAFGYHAVPVPIDITAIGERRAYQCWFRDPAHPDLTGVGLSDALDVTFEP